MASKQPLIDKPKAAGHSKASVFYGADAYLEELQRRYEHHYEIAALMGEQPDSKNRGSKKKGDDENPTLKAKVDDTNRSLISGRLRPDPNTPDPMPEHLKFLFTPVTPEQKIYMWNVLTALFVVMCLMVCAYSAALATFPSYWWTCTLIFGIPFSYLSIQSIYIDHDVLHGSMLDFKYSWQKYLTHPFADFFSLPWEEFIAEHMLHHQSTNDLLLQGEFGWDPEQLHYELQQWATGLGSWTDGWYKYILTVPWIPVLHFFGLNDTGALFALEWWAHMPDAAAGGKCNSQFWKKLMPCRIWHNLFVFCLWTCVWMLGTYPLGRPLQEGWRFMFTVSFFARVGYSLAWMFITNFTHSLPWNRFLENDLDRTYPILHAVMATVLGGRHRWNEMLFHDVHHTFPGTVGTLSQRGRFHGWEKVHDAAAEVLAHGLWKANGDEETEMQKTQRRRSMKLKERSRK